MYDCAIIGSGLVGCVSALVLAQAGLRVALVDKEDPTKRSLASVDRRGIAVARGSEALLDQVGVWSILQQFGSPILNIRVSNAHRRGAVHYGQEETNGIPMGHIIEGYRLKQTLNDAVAKEHNIDCFMPFTLSSLDNLQDHVEIKFQRPSTQPQPHSPKKGPSHLGEKDLTLSQECSMSENSGSFKAKNEPRLDPEQNGLNEAASIKEDRPDLRARFCLGADGKNSWVRHHLDIAYKKWDYQQTALVFVVQHEHPHHHLAFEHFLPRGPLALLPMAGNRSSVVWTESSDAAKRMGSLDPVDFSEEVSRLFGATLGKLTLEGERYSYPLTGQLALHPRKGRCLLIGDAAHAIHPVAGQGFNLGIRDVQWIQAHKEQLLDPVQTLQTLEGFSRQRAGDVLSMTGLTHGLVKLFSNDLETLGRVRSAGLKVANALPFLKKRLTRRAMGLG